MDILLSIVTRLFLRDFLCLMDFRSLCGVSAPNDEHAYAQLAAATADVGGPIMYPPRIPGFSDVLCCR